MIGNRYKCEGRGLGFVGSLDKVLSLSKKIDISWNGVHDDGKLWSKGIQFELC